MSTPNLQVPGKHDKERRVFHHTLNATETTGADTVASFFMDNALVGSIAGTPSIVSPNPGFTHPVIATHVFTDYIHGGLTLPGNWTLRLRKNEAIVDSATFVMNSGGAGIAHQKTCGQWDPHVRFDPCDTYYITADGPERVIVLIRAILRFEELS